MGRVWKKPHFRNSRQQGRTHRIMRHGVVMECYKCQILLQRPQRIFQVITFAVLNPFSSTNPVGTTLVYCFAIITAKPRPHGDGFKDRVQALLMVTIVACVAENDLVPIVGVTTSTDVTTWVHSLGRGKGCAGIIVIRLQVECAFCLGVPAALRPLPPTQGSQQPVLWHRN